MIDLECFAWCVCICELCSNVAQIELVEKEYIQEKQAAQDEFQVCKLLWSYLWTIQMSWFRWSCMSLAFD